jgi:hypothetical protein
MVRAPFPRGKPRDRRSAVDAYRGDAR